MSGSQVHPTKHTLSEHPLILRINPYYLLTLSIHPINTPYQHTLSTHPINPPYQSTLSTQSLTLSIHPITHSLYQTSLLTHLFHLRTQPSEPIKVGKASPTEGALPGSLYLALKYQHSLEEGLIANAGIGGDSAVRGMVVGMLLGAVKGRAGIPGRWIEVDVSNTR